MNLPAVFRRALLAPLIFLSLCVFVGCMTEPPTAAQPISQSATSTIPSLPPTSATDYAPTATVSVVAESTEPATTTRELAPLQPLRNETIVDRALDHQALTNGQKKYKTAVWSPGAEWIAAVPQDGPGLDVVSAETGAQHAVVTDTYVLEPVWLDHESLLVHEIANTTDVLVQYTLTGAQIVSRVVAEGEQPLRAVGAAGGTLSYVDAAGLHVQQPGRADASWSVPLDALVSVPAPVNNAASAVAVSPWVADLQQVQTALVERRDDRITSTFVSNAGEGLWLPQWAPDAAKLALTDIAGRIVTTTVDGRSRYDLGPGDRPAWSPDSSRIAFAGTSAGKEFLSRDIYIVDWQGAGPRFKLTNANDEQFYTSPSWSPDGTRVAFVEIDSGQIFVGAVPQP